MATVQEVKDQFDAFRQVVQAELGEIDQALDKLIARIEAIIVAGSPDPAALDALKQEIVDLQADVQTKADAVEAKADAERP